MGTSQIHPLNLPPIDKERQALHGFYKFPGSFHPPLVNHLLKNTNSYDIIGDPMSGSGTVALESIVLGRNIISMDIDPLSCLITSVKSNPISSDKLSTIFKKWISCIGHLPLTFTSRERAISYKQKLESETKYRFPSNAFHWFDPYILCGLSQCLISLHELNLEDSLNNIFEAIIAASIRRISRADPNPVSGLEVTKIALRRLENGLTFDIMKELQNRFNILLNGYKYLNGIDNLVQSRVFRGNIKSDWVRLSKSNNIIFDTIITSPPYCNAIEYWRRHRLEYFLLGFMNNDQIREESRTFIGSTTIFKKQLDEMDETSEIISNQANQLINQIKLKGKIRKAQLIKQYFLESEKWISAIMSTIDKSGQCYIVVGPSTSYGITIDTPFLLHDISHKLGYNSEIIMKYGIKNHRMQYSTRNNVRIRTESVLKISH